VLMKCIFIASRMDKASANTGDFVKKIGNFRGVKECSGLEFYSNGQHLFVETEELHIYCNGIDRKIRECGFNENYSCLVFLSSHRSVSGKPSITFHPVGNIGTAELGGKERSLSPSSPALMTHYLLAAHRTDLREHYDITFEATHHGPLVEMPALFAEIGSTEEQWTDSYTAEALARIVLNAEEAEGINVIGIGGGHYCPRFRDIALRKKVNFGHVVSHHYVELLDASMCLELKAKSPDTENFIVHEANSGDGENDKVRRLLEEAGFSEIRSEDIELR
jgi:D-aminoacyl-tRNA deacylase